MISSDNGKEFVDKTVKGIHQKLGIRQRLGCVYHPQSQGMVERVNGVLKAKITKICDHTNLDWVDALPLALMTYRSGVNRKTQLTLHKMLTGQPMPVPTHRHMQKDLP